MAESNIKLVHILLTGATGFIGRALADDLLLQSDYQLRCSARRLEQLEQKYNPVQIENINGETNWSAALHNIDCVIHAAGRAHVFAATDKSALDEFRQINTAGTINFARQAAAKGVKRFIFLSSIGVNGTVSQKPFLSTDKPNARDAYSVSKLEAELELQKLAETVSMEIVIIRPPLVYGPDAPGNFGRLLSLVRKVPVLPLGAIYNKRSLVSIDNLVDLIKLCIRHPQAAGQTFLVSDDSDVSTTDLLKLMSDALGVKRLLLPVPVRLLHLSSRLIGLKELSERLCSSLEVDIRHTKETLSWVPPVTTEDAIKRIVSTKV